jgi:sec-independent protein translocase protein TatB
MFDVGGGELVLLFIIGLLVLGPQRLPKVAAELGKWAGRARRTATELRRQLEREIELSEVVQPPKPPPAPKPPPLPETATPPSHEQSVASAGEGNTSAPDNAATGAAESVADAPTSPETADKSPQA